MRLICLIALGSIAVGQGVLYPVAQTGVGTPRLIQSGEMEQVSLFSAFYPILFTGGYQLKIVVPNDAASLEIKTSNTGINLYVGTNEITLSNGRVQGATYGLENTPPANSDTLTIQSPPAGTYYLAFGTMPGESADTTIIATVSQCTYRLRYTPPLPLKLPAAGLDWGGEITTQPGCEWALTSDPWLRTSPSSGIGSKLIQLHADPNPGPERRTNLYYGGGGYNPITQLGGAVPVVAPNALILSQFVGGGGWHTTLIVSNNSTTTERFTARFFNADGAAVSMPIAGMGVIDTFTGALAPGETKRYETDAAQVLHQSWAALNPENLASQGLTGFAIFRQQTSNGPASEAIVDFMRSNSGKFVLLYDSSTGFATGAALANPSPLGSIDIRAEIRDEAGAILGTETITLPALGRMVFEVQQRFPQTAGKRGSIRFDTSPRTLAGLGLRFSPFGTFTSFPLLEAQ